MGYSIMVFEPSAAPSDRAGFIAWYQRQTDWQQGLAYDDHEATTPRLRAFFLDMIKTFPPLNGPLAADEPDDGDPHLTEYNIGAEFIYVSGAWSAVGAGTEHALDLAAAHGLGVFDTTSDEVSLPAAGGMAHAFSTAPGVLEKELAPFRKAVDAIRRLFGKGS
ncbi:hypothetical protein [Ancylobacter terrae]|uniref:hypothetical protein n=1 Tax=Ancylobacter sp. sgz301288 TaxID=3342077 RepID=UPI00385D7933